MRTLAFLSLLGLSIAAVPAEAFAPRPPVLDDVIHRVEGMVWDEQVRQYAHREGLSVVNVTWEDTGRSKNSAWGPNISDMTIGVRDTTGALHPMPVVRFDNYSDTTADVRSDRFYVRVGNEDGRGLQTVSIRDILQNVRGYLHDPSSWAGAQTSLWAARDEHLLVSAQACFLPIPQQGAATFTPVIYNYQSYPGAPAVLTIVATREGTSIQVVENDGGYLSEVLYFNENGQRAPFTAERLSDFQAKGGDAITSASEASESAGVNAVLVIQVPLKQKVRARSEDFSVMMAPAAAAGGAPMKSAAPTRDVEAAVVGHGPVEGPFTELHHLAIERDPQFPVRVTVQFYKATSNGVVSSADIAAIRRQIDAVYAGGDAVGSLVTAGHTGRATEWVTPARPETAVWADSWWSWSTVR